MALIEGQIIQWLKEKGQTVMYKTLHKKAVVLSVLLSGPLYYLSFYQGHCIICPSIRAVVLSVLLSGQLYYLSFYQGREGQIIQWP
jgi:hypothetical protein